MLNLAFTVRVMSSDYILHLPSLHPKIHMYSHVVRRDTMWLSTVVISIAAAGLGWDLDHFFAKIEGASCKKPRKI